LVTKEGTITHFVISPVRVFLLILGCAAVDPQSRQRGELGFGELEDSDLKAASDLATFDLAEPAHDLKGADLQAVADLKPSADLLPSADLKPPADLSPAAPDLAFVVQHVHILIDNQCHTSTSPTEITWPLHQPLQIDWHNHSVDYSADVWMSYNGGFTDLPTGDTWHEKHQHCLNPVAYDAWADVSIGGGGTASCPKFRVMIHCR
jgi:hypothetical protein